jgi:hypothetical protein
MNNSVRRYRSLIEMWLAVYAVCGVFGFISRGYFMYSIAPGFVCLLVFYYYHNNQILRRSLLSYSFMAIGGGFVLLTLFSFFPKNDSILSFVGVIFVFYLGLRVYLLYSPLLKKAETKQT